MYQKAKQNKMEVALTQVSPLSLLQYGDQELEIHDLLLEYENQLQQ